MIKHVLLSLVLAQAALGAGCSDVHSPQAGDTNTSWLRLCEDDGDCRGAARCLSNVCTLSCAGPSANSCRQLSPQATCSQETNTCDVSCDSAQDCRTFGADFRCEAGSCRPSPEFTLSAETLLLAARDQGAIRYRMMDTVQAILLADRFRIAVTVFDESPAQPDAVTNWKSTLVVTDVFPDGQVERQLLSNDSPLSSATFTLSQNGAVARSDSESDPGTFDASIRSGFPAPTRCRLTFYGPDLAELSTGTHDCEQGLTPITSDAKGDWLASATPENDDIALGRYRPSEHGWVDQPRRLAVQNGWLSTQVRDDQLWIRMHDARWGTSSLISVPFMGSLEDLSLSEAWRSLPVDARLANSPHQQGGWRLMYYRDGWLIPYDEAHSAGQVEPVVRAIPVDQGELQPVSFAVDAEGTIGFSALRPIPDKDLVFICYVDFITRDDDRHLELKLSWFDAQGTPLGGPLTLAHTLQQPQMCSLTWSGNALLAAWTESGPSEPGVAYARHVRMR